MILNKEEKMTKLLEMPNKFHIRKRCTNLQLWDFTNWTSTAENMQHKIIHLFTPLHRGYGSFFPPFYSLSYIFARECWGNETGVPHQHGSPDYSFDMGRLKVASIVPCGSSIGKYTSSANFTNGFSLLPKLTGRK